MGKRLASATCTERVDAGPHATMNISDGLYLHFCV